jgi:hypothetical protein
VIGSRRGLHGPPALSFVVEFPASLWKLNISLRINQKLSVEKEIAENCRIVSHEQQNVAEHVNEKRALIMRGVLP